MRNALRFPSMNGRLGQLRFSAQASTPYESMHPKLVSRYADPQQSHMSDECRMLFGRRDGIHPHIGDVPLLVEESYVTRTFVNFERSSLNPVGGDVAIEVEAPLSGVTVLGTAFDAGTDILMTQCNREVQMATSTLSDAGVVAAQLAAPQRSVWATDEEIFVYNLSRCPHLPNTVMRADGAQYHRTTLPWFGTRLFTSFDLETRLPFSPRVQVALRRWCLASQTWWSVWGSVEGYAQAGIAVVDQPVDLHVIDEWGDTKYLVSAYSCMNPQEAIDYVYGSKRGL
ncbi:Hypothetical protein, putative [Bodo saltans]|uniref:Uncharacterized protein n=1 Tax=Bodo saltans TaxID=75058 RepID=A0A0S4J7Y2_BODSA|nr:Hypothetical protein, putative [Bodo saltans]|eukprot:CUG87512.1 Hypothetical protein, putative [Bodo saltans]